MEKTKYKRIKKTIKNSKDIVIGILLGIIVSTASARAATILFAASETSYDDTKAGTAIGSSDVQDALDKIYGMTKDCNENIVNVSISPSNAGSVSPSTMTLTKGNSGTFNVTPNSGYGKGTVSCTNAQSATLKRTADPSTLTIEPTVDTNCTVTYQNVGTYTINLTTVNATINGETSKTATVGGSALFTVTPSTGYGFLTSEGDYLIGELLCYNGEGNTPSDVAIGYTYIVSSNSVRILVTSATAGSTFSCTLRAVPNNNFTYTTSTSTTSFNSVLSPAYCCANSFTFNTNSGRFTINGILHSNKENYGVGNNAIGKYCVPTGIVYGIGSEGDSCTYDETEITKFNSCATTTTSDSSYCWESSDIEYKSSVSSGSFFFKW